MDYRTNGLDTLRIAATVQVAMNSSLSVEDLAGFGVERLRELWSKCPPGMQATATNEAVEMALARAARPTVQPLQQLQQLQKLPADKYAGYSLNVDGVDEFAGYDINAARGADDEGDLLRAVTALRNAMQSASSGALTTLGLETLEGWRKQVAKAVAATSASVAQNAGLDQTGGLPRAGGDKYAGYSLNEPADEFAGYSLNDAT